MPVKDILPLTKEQSLTRKDEDKYQNKDKEDNQMTHAQTVRCIVEFIMSSKLPSYEKDKLFRKRFPNFAESMPKVFEMVIKDDLNDQSRMYINMMLDMSERLLDKKELEVIEADKIIYNKLREDHIDPIIKPDKSKIGEFMSRSNYTEEELSGGSQMHVDVKNPK